jgi:endonuclease/exonuclease/phosphatase family metal-dependent hydrolase
MRHCSRKRLAEAAAGVVVTSALAAMIPFENVSNSSSGNFISSAVVTTPLKVVIGLAMGAAIILIARMGLMRLRIVLDDRLQPTTISVLSANVGNAALTRMLRGFQLQDKDIPVLQSNIAALGPDVILLQEIAHEAQVGALIDRRKYEIYFENAICTAVRRGVFHDLTPQEHSAGDEGFTVCAAILAREEIPITLVNVHTTSPLKDRSFKTRGQQIRTLLDEIVRKAKAGEKLVVGGDFNFDPYRFHSKREAGEATELDLTRKKWFGIFDNRHNGGLVVFSSDRLTWQFKNFTYTLDHIISNLDKEEFEILDGDGERIDVNHSDNQVARERFMDHRAILCRTVVVNEKRWPFKKRAEKPKL